MATQGSGATHASAQAETDYPAEVGAHQQGSTSKNRTKDRGNANSTFVQGSLPTSDGAIANQLGQSTAQAKPKEKKKKKKKRASTSIPIPVISRGAAVRMAAAQSPTSLFVSSTVRATTTQIARRDIASSPVQLAGSHHPSSDGKTSTFSKAPERTVDDDSASAAARQFKAGQSNGQPAAKVAVSTTASSPLAATQSSSHNTKDSGKHKPEAGASLLKRPAKQSLSQAAKRQKVKASSNAGKTGATGVAETQRISSPAKVPSPLAATASASTSLDNTLTVERPPQKRTAATSSLPPHGNKDASSQGEAGTRSTAQRNGQATAFTQSQSKERPRSGMSTETLTSLLLQPGEPHQHKVEQQQQQQQQQEVGRRSSDSEEDVVVPSKRRKKRLQKSPSATEDEVNSDVRLDSQRGPSNTEKQPVASSDVDTSQTQSQAALHAIVTEDTSALDTTIPVAALSGKGPSHCTTCLVPFRGRRRPALHPDLEVLVCSKCAEGIESVPLVIGDDGYHGECCWCHLDGVTLFCCSKCPRGFCPTEIELNLGAKEKARVEADENWQCYVCNPGPIRTLQAKARLFMTSFQQRRLSKQQRRTSIASSAADSRTASPHVENAPAPTEATVTRSGRIVKTSTQAGASGSAGEGTPSQSPRRRFKREPKEATIFCPFEGCPKAYTTALGLKYHLQHAHKPPKPKRPKPAVKKNKIKPAPQSPRTPTPPPTEKTVEQLAEEEGLDMTPTASGRPRRRAAARAIKMVREAASTQLKPANGSGDHDVDMPLLSSGGSTSFNTDGATDSSDGDMESEGQAGVQSDSDNQVMDSDGLSRGTTPSKRQSRRRKSGADRRVSLPSAAIGEYHSSLSEVADRHWKRVEQRMQAPCFTRLVATARDFEQVDGIAETCPSCACVEVNVGKHRISCDLVSSHTVSTNDQHKITLLRPGLLVTCMAWLPQAPTDTSPSVLAIGTDPTGAAFGSVTETRTGRGEIQLWQLPRLVHGDPSCCEPVILQVQHGAPTALAWCPFGGSLAGGARAQDADLPRIGLLAAGFEDGQVVLFSVPDLIALGKTLGFDVKSRPLRVKPTAMCSFAGPLAQPLCLAWSSSRMCGSLAAGYANGSVAVWSIPSTVESVPTHWTSRRRAPKSRAVMPRCVCRPLPHGCHPIRAIAWKPDSEDTLACTGHDADVVIVHGCRSQTPKVVQNIATPPQPFRHWKTDLWWGWSRAGPMFAGHHEAARVVVNDEGRTSATLEALQDVTCVTGSDWLDVAAGGSDDGQVGVFVFPKAGTDLPRSRDIHRGQVTALTITSVLNVDKAARREADKTKTSDQREAKQDADDRTKAQTNGSAHGTSGTTSSTAEQGRQSLLMTPCSTSLDSISLSIEPKKELYRRQCGHVWQLSELPQPMSVTKVSLSPNMPTCYWLAAATSAGVVVIHNIKDAVNEELAFLSSLEPSS